MSSKVSFKTGILEVFNLVCLLLVVLVIPIATASAFDTIDQNAYKGKSVLGVSTGTRPGVDPTKDNTAVLSTVSEQLSTINDNTISTKILIVIGATFFAITIFLLVTLVSHIYKRPEVNGNVEKKLEEKSNNDKENNEVKDNEVITEEAEP